jgi:type I restriction enzyme S subunit
VILSSIAILRPNESIDPHFLAFTLKGEGTLGRMEKYVSGAVLQRIVLKAFRDLPIIVPPRTLQDAWAELIAPLVTMCWRNVGQSDTLSSLRETILPKLLSGAIRIPTENSA